jgi:hypothetical protein
MAVLGMRMPRLSRNVTNLAVGWFLLPVCLQQLAFRIDGTDWPSPSEDGEKGQKKSALDSNESQGARTALPRKLLKHNLRLGSGTVNRTLVPPGWPESARRWAGTLRFAP